MELKSQYNCTHYHTSLAQRCTKSKYQMMASNIEITTDKMNRYHMNKSYKRLTQHHTGLSGARCKEINELPQFNSQI